MTLRWGSTWAANVLAIAMLSIPTGGKAQPETGPYFDPISALPRGYELRVSAAVHRATRDDFSHLLLLFRNRVERIAALEVVAQLDLRVSITPSLALQVVAPLSWREVLAQLDGVVISQSEQLPDRTLRLSGIGIGDPTLGLAYRVTSLAPLELFVDGGASVAVDDNPESATLPRRIPPGAGQGRLFLGAGARLTVGTWTASLAYRASYYPNAAATYLIRRASRQSYASGALSDRARHSVSALCHVRPWQALSLSLTPTLSTTSVADIVERGQAYPVVFENWLTQLSLRAAVRLHLSSDHSLELFYRQPLVDTWRIDPMFPLVMPAQGGGIMWVVSGS